MKASEIRQMARKELENRLNEDLEALSKMRFQLATSQLTNTSQINSVKKDIARMKTVLREWELRGETK